MQTFTPSGGLSPASGLFAFLPHTAPKSFKQALGDEIERMIDMLDSLDGDTDLEPDLAGTPNQGAACDAEGDDSDVEPTGDELEPDVDDEPSLGSLGACGSLYLQQAQSWSGGSDDDREQEEGDLEPDNDGEPSLGSLDRMVNQERWTSTHDSMDACSDREHDDCDQEDGGDTEANGDELDLNGDETDGPDAEREPSLGSINPHGDLDQGQWAAGNAGGSDEERAAPSGFARVRRALADEHRETLEETRRLSAIIRQLSGGEEVPNGGNLRLLTVW